MSPNLYRLLLARHGLVVAILALASVSLLPGVADATAGQCPNETMPGFRMYLPDCRAYELVSPAYKEGSPVFPQGISADGEALRIESFGSFSNPQSIGNVGITYRVTRTEAGWESSSLDEPLSIFPQYFVEGMSSDLQSSLWFASTQGRSVRDVYLRPPSGEMTLMGPGSPEGAREGQLNYVGASDDLSHVLLRDRSPAGSEEVRIWPGDTTVEGRYRSLYEYEGTGNSEPRLVGVSNEERVEAAARKEGRQHINEAATLVSNCGTSLGNAEERDGYNAVSASGTTVYFTAEAGEACSSPTVNELYARIAGERTVAISEPSLSVPGRECTGGCATASSQAGEFAGASRDGSKVFFLTSQPLVNGDRDAGVDLYEAEIPPGAVTRLEHGESAITRLVQVSRGGPGDPTPGSGANVLGVARVSEDGSRVYFVAEGALTGANREGMRPAAGEPNMYVSTSECPDGGALCADPVERTSFIGTLSREDERDWGLQ